MDYDSTNFFYKREWFDRPMTIGEWYMIERRVPIELDIHELVEYIKSHLFDEKIEELP